MTAQLRATDVHGDPSWTVRLRERLTTVVRLRARLRRGLLASRRGGAVSAIGGHNAAMAVLESGRLESGRAS